MDSPQRPAPTLKERAAWAAAVGAVLVATFALYGQPDFLVTLANQIWACF